MAGLLEKCPHCGNSVMFMGDICPGCQAHRHKDVEQVRHERQETTLAFNQETIQQRPLVASMNRLVIGAGIVAGATFVGALLMPGLSFMSFIGCIAGLGIVNRFVFGDADVLDKLRWARYWHGDVLGYWISYLALLALLPSRSDGSGEAMIYLYATLIAFAVGICNVLRTDRADKEALGQVLQRLAADAAPSSSKLGTTEAARSAGT